MKNTISTKEHTQLNFSISRFAVQRVLLCRQEIKGYTSVGACWRFSILVNCDFQVFFNFKVILYVAKITHNTATEVI